jgi:hypothetical protein
MRYLERFTERMGDLAMFMPSLKQRFSRWHNGRNRRKGTLWEDRYRSVAVEIQDLATLGAAARLVSAYIDLNPVRAGMVEDPTEYPWCGYARALVGEKESAKGLLRVWGKQRGLKGALAEYRVYFFEEGSEEKVEKTQDGKTQDGKTQDTRHKTQDTRAGGETDMKMAGKGRFRIRGRGNGRRGWG